ncbi:hypothetical protein TRV_02317 [Trichophyton verrucosum HKI 0517]|uniref:Uncharacterized protein n=1 Tax=Trichophyton verrucosum (strain HKI 0517) TaxID=663202 RepID=D4D5E7_TRIVH|nr:uncharacterized protein TRV_02317 [Trichophyton verrucosum HKI 0517]EFE42952.1 hypothetical protein TRV_02317 [Trichophyton verrucosum HKI 0517]
MPSITSPSGPPAIFSHRRMPLSQEYHVMDRYAGHASRCKVCANPVEAITKGRNLCDRGIRHAHNFILCIRSLEGKAYAAADIEFTPKEIDIPPQFSVISDLLRALDLGLLAKLQKPQPVVINTTNNTRSSREDNVPSSPASPSTSLPERSSSTVVVVSSRKGKETSRDDLSFSRRGTLYPDETPGQLVTRTYHSTSSKSGIRVPSTYLS